MKKGYHIKQFYKKLKQNYIVALYDQESYSKIWTGKISILKATGIILGYTSMIVIGFFLLAYYTPIGIHLAGDRVVDKRVLLKLNAELDKALMDLERQKLYIHSLKKKWLGQAETEEEVVMKQPPALPHTRGIVRKIKEDSILRAQMAQNPTMIDPQPIKVENKVIDTDILHIRPPIKGEISAAFMEDKNHFGVDIIAPKNTPVQAILPGHVIVADWTETTGYTIGIQHKNNIVSFYKHNSKLLKKTGDFVQAGEAIAIIGNSGILTSGPHLHFELWINGRPVNPLQYIVFH